jgi:hypothetical protein
MTNRKKETNMRSHITKLVAGLAAVAALAVGGSSLASAASKASPAPAVTTTTADIGSVQQGNQNAPDLAAGSESSTESTTDSASEVAGNDGPGGHADEPGNANVDHQFDGQE